MSHTPAAPAYHRQRLLLFLLEHAGGRLGRMDLQKLLFLYMQESGERHYAFVPYRFGSYSFQANDDLELLCKRNWILEDGKDWVLAASVSGRDWAFTSEERERLRKWLARNPLRGDDLVRDLYRRFPYYAVRSEMKERLLSEAELAQVHAALPADHAFDTLITVGYEGITFEEYVNKLLQNGVRLLCDVRRNPLSRKFGFSKSTLSSLLPRLGIEYEHLPELGIASEARQNLDAGDAREALFLAYARELPAQANALDRVIELLRMHGCVALTCFEHEAQECHRHCVSDFLAARHGMAVQHL